MNIRNFKSALPKVIKHDIVPFVWGMQGVGKTQTVKQIADSLKIGFCHLHLATQEVGDLVGLLKQNKDGTVSHSRPEWFPTEGEGILFLDELNRAHPDVVQACFSLITSKTIHTHTLPPGWKIVAAGNYQSSEFTVTDTSDQAWMSRFCHIDFEPEVEEFCNYAEKRGADTVAEFIRADSSCLEAGKRDKPELKITPDRRAWLEMIAPLENEEFDEVTRFELYKGIVGFVAATAFRTYKMSSEKKLRLKDILKRYDMVRERVISLSAGKEARLDILNVPIEEITEKLKDSEFVMTFDECENFKRYLLDIPKECVVSFTKKASKLMFKNKDQLLNDAEFCKRIFA